MLFKQFFFILALLTLKSGLVEGKSKHRANLSCVKVSYYKAQLLFCSSYHTTSLAMLGHNGGLVVSVFAFYSDDPSSHPAG